MFLISKKSVLSIVSFLLMITVVISCAFLPVSAKNTSIFNRGIVRHLGTYTPKKGDIVFFSYNSDGTQDHVGIVYSVKGKKIVTIEGNYGSGGYYNTRVTKVKRSMSYPISNFICVRDLVSNAKANKIANVAYKQIGNHGNKYWSNKISNPLNAPDEWCAMFAGWCLLKAKLNPSDFAFFVGCPYWVGGAMNISPKMVGKASFKHIWRKNTYEPFIGDVVFFKNTAGIITEIKKKDLKIVCGSIKNNKPQIVKRTLKNYKKNSDIIGYTDSLRVTNSKTGGQKIAEKALSAVGKNAKKLLNSIEVTSEGFSKSNINQTYKRFIAYAFEQAGYNPVQTGWDCHYGENIATTRDWIVRAKFIKSLVSKDFGKR